MTPELKKLGSLEALIVKGDPGLATFVVLHGYGADASDLWPLSRILAVHRPYNWIFANAPLLVPIGFHMTGRAWFPIDIEALQRTPSLAQIDSTPLQSSTNQVLQLLEAAQVKPENLVLMGFSQGAMIAVDTCLRLAVNPRGLVVLSGALLDRKRVLKEGPKRSGLQFFQSHGKYDQVLAFGSGQELENALKQSGLSGDLLAFEGGHEIPEVVIHALNAYFRKISL